VRSRLASQRASRRLRSVALIASQSVRLVTRSTVCGSFENRNLSNTSTKCLQSVIGKWTGASSQSVIRSSQFEDPAKHCSTTVDMSMLRRSVLTLRRYALNGAENAVAF
jgi:hypothetical protein